MLFDWYGSVRVPTTSTERERERSLTNLLPTKLRPGRSVTWTLARLWQLFVRLSNIVVHWVHYVKSHWYFYTVLYPTFLRCLVEFFILITTLCCCDYYCYSVFRNELFNRLNKFWNHRISCWIFALILFNEASSRPVCYYVEPQHFWLKIKLILFCTIRLSFFFFLDNPSPQMLCRLKFSSLRRWFLFSMLRQNNLRLSSLQWQLQLFLVTLCC